ncbi:hypothetical protein BDD26_3549 [Xenorhabdus cabanillasii]|uniref:Uncharacterized protein n=1 Tax=Xenorhabdus cabanillasii TaxID=351673 RepID=A0A3D9UKZ2_9GAMM|nr:hypothetical protein BDD26_3549 [Xenorhabdus cabanillasii]
MRFRQVNGKSLADDVNLNVWDIGAQPVGNYADGTRFASTAGGGIENHYNSLNTKSLFSYLPFMPLLMPPNFFASFSFPI